MIFKCIKVNYLEEDVPEEEAKAVFIEVVGLVLEVSPLKEDL